MVDVERAGIDRAVVAVGEFLGGPVPDADGWRFDFGEHLESNWGAVYGGALAAGAVAVARAAAPDRSPRSLHLQMVRSLPRGSARAAVQMRHAGRTVAAVEVDLFDGRGKLAVVALVTMVTPGAIAADQHDTTANVFHERMVQPHLAGGPITPPISHALEMIRYDNGSIVEGLVENARPSIDGTFPSTTVVTVPWEDLAVTGPEAACLVADAAVGVPILRSTVPSELLGPNPDLSLRFTTAPATRVVKAAAAAVSVQHGTATVALEVQAGDQQLAHGLATSLLLAR